MATDLFSGGAELDGLPDDPPALQDSYSGLGCQVVEIRRPVAAPIPVMEVNQRIPRRYEGTCPAETSGDGA